MKNADLQHIQYILRYCEEIVQTIHRFGESFQTFTSDADYHKSISMSLLQIGEHAKSLSDEVLVETKADIPWTGIKGMRDHFAHGYGEMSSKMIWETAVQDIQLLRTALQDFLAQNNA